MRNLSRRLNHLEQRSTIQIWGAIPIVDPRFWPPEIREAYERADAGGDLVTLADIVEAQTGNRPAFDRTDGAIAMIEIGQAEPRTDGLTP